MPHVDPSSPSVTPRIRSLLYSIETSPVTLVDDTSDLALALLDNGYALHGYSILLVSPSPVSTAQKYSLLRSTSLGSLVGYQGTFEKMRSPESRILVMNSSALVQELIGDPLLAAFSIIIFDASDLMCDVALCLLKAVLRSRPSLRLVINVMSPGRMLAYFGHESCSTMIRPPLPRVTYLDSPCADYIQAAVETCFQIHAHSPPGNILVALPGAPEMALFAAKTNAHLDASGITDLVLSSTAAPTSSTHRQIFATTGHRDIPHVAYVIDPGLIRIPIFNVHSHFCMNLTCVAPQSLMLSRARRASPHGLCYRLYTKESFLGAPEDLEPECARVDLVPAILVIMSLNIGSPLRFDWISTPASCLVASALEYLVHMHAVTNEASLTPRGEFIAALVPFVDPAMASALHYASQLGCLEELLSIAAMTCVDSPFLIDSSSKDIAPVLARRNFTAREGDHLTLLNVYEAFADSRGSAAFCAQNHLDHAVLTRAVSVRHQLAHLCTRRGLALSTCGRSFSLIQRALAASYFLNAVRAMPDGTYTSLRDSRLTVRADASSVFAVRKPPTPFVVFSHAVQDDAGVVSARHLSCVHLDDLVHSAPHFYKEV